MKKLWIVLVALAVVAGGVWYFLARRGAADGAEKFRTEVVDKGDVAMVVTATGTISAVTTVQVGSQVSGIIAALHADFNTPVKKGQLLAELDPTPFEATVEQRKADLQSAQVKALNSKIQMERQAHLLAENLVAQSDFDGAKTQSQADAAAVDLAKAALSQAQTNLAYTKIVSPIDGVVVERDYDVGQTVAASFQAPTLFTIAQDLTKMQVQADVDQSDIGSVKVGQTATFTVDAYPDEQFSGQITQIRLNATVSQNVVTYPVIIEVPNPDLKLRPKMTADLTIEVARVHDVLRVANAALRFRPAETTGGAGAPGARAGAAGAAGGAAGAGRTAAGAGGAAGSPEARLARATSGAGVEGAAETLAAGARPASRNWQSVYRLGATGQLERVRVRVGITDGKFTEVVEGELQPGDKIVTGLATAKAGQSGQPFGGGRRF